MSCEVKIFGRISDLKTVQEFLGFSQDEAWLNAVYYSISPTGEVLVFGHGTKLVILSAHQASNYSITWRGELGNPNDVITAVICLPVYGVHTSSGAEWNCVVVGLSSGLVQFYTDSGVQIFSQRWHMDTVQFIKTQSGKRIKDELYVGYTSCICIVQGTHLFPALKMLKNKYSKTVTSNSSASKLNGAVELVQCRKWKYRSNSTVVNDVVVVGPQKTCSFDHLLEQSFEGGFFTRLRSAPTQNSLILGAGVKPFVGFHYAKEGFVQADLGDVAKAVASKVMSSLPWLFKQPPQTQQSQEETLANQPGESMSLQFGICDHQRHGLSIQLAPEHQLAIVTDNLGRIVLVDCVRGIALRMWKGYRDAQCSFIKVREKALNKTDKSERRKCIFLVIFAPRRSCLEIWALQNGPKVAAFSACKYGQLICNNYGLMGVPPTAKVKCSINTCLFLDPSDDSLKEILVPFHCALSESNSKTAKDVHLLRRIKMCLRGHTTGNADEIVPEISEACKNIQTNEMRVQCLEMLAKNKKAQPVILKTAISTMQSELENSEGADLTYGDADNCKSLVLLLTNYQKLVDFYMAIKETPSNQASSSQVDKLCLAENDLEAIQKLVDLSAREDQGSPGSTRVTFQEKIQDDDFIEYLSAFEIETEEIHLKRDLQTDTMSNIGKTLFSRFLEKGDPSDIFSSNSVASSICTDDFIKLVLHYWLQRPFAYTKSEEIIEDMTHLASIIQHICDLAGDNLEFEYNAICPWWQNIREIVLESPCALRGLLCAIVCRNTAAKTRKKELDDSSSNEDEVWEQVSQEAAQWSLLIGKLDDISVLGAILSYPVLSTTQTLPSLSYEKPDCSLKEILKGGKGIVAELVSKWLTHSGINPQAILEENSPEKLDGSQVKPVEPNEENGHIENSNESNPILKSLKILREHFPFSLESGILLSHMTWEFMSHWSKTLPSMKFLQAGLTCLNTFRKEDHALKHGLCCMVWNAHFKIPLEATKKLINKAGRLPKETFCQQDIGISDSLVPDLLDYCLEFFRHFSSSLEYDKRDLKFEEILQDGQIPLPQFILQQNHAIPEIVDLHVQLCKMLHLISFFSLKATKPVQNLFDAMANQTFFTEINRELTYKLPPPDQVLQRRRLDFACKAVTASMDLIREDLERLYVLEHAQYMTKIESLVEMWNLDKILIKKHQIVEMYAHGWDAYAEELLESIVDSYDLGPLLLEIAGRRLNVIVGTSGKKWSHIASVGSFLTDYLDTLKLDTKGIPINDNLEEIHLDELKKLTGKAFHCLSKKDSKELRIAGQMFDACEILRVMQK